MCLILFSYHQHPDFPLILASNRDEFYKRPSSRLHFWSENQSILAGQDEEGGGTWLGASVRGRFAAITNFRDPSRQMTNARSRGLIVRGFLESAKNPQDYMETLSRESDTYNGYNFLAGDLNSLWYFSNIEQKARVLEPGIYGLSNHLLDTPWPKVVKGKKALHSVASEGRVDRESVFRILADTDCPSDSELPDTGIGLEWERILGPLFINSEIYGTRCSTIVSIDRDGQFSLTERRFGIGGNQDLLGESSYDFYPRSE